MISVFSSQISLRNKLWDFKIPKIMGIINVTPDSFYAGSRVSIDNIGSTATKMLADGADILDIGAASSRPGASVIDASQEYDRIAPALEQIRKAAPDAVISIDTFYAEVAKKCVANFDADIINDISGGILDVNMFQTIADLQVPYILTHTRGTPENMQTLTDYDDVTADVLRDLAFKLDKLRQLGVADVIVDPGFGFAKTVDQNYRLLAKLDIFHQTGCPVLAGLSRKSMICKPLNITPDESLIPTSSLNTIALMNGADILRVHDVREAAQIVKLFSLLKENLNHSSFSIETIEHPL